MPGLWCLLAYAIGVSNPAKILHTPSTLRRLSRHSKRRVGVPIALIEPAAQSYAAGRVDEAVGYIEVGQAALERGCYADVPFGFEAALGTAYHLKGEPEKAAAMLRNTIARSSGAHTLPRAMLALALSGAGACDEAMAVAEGILVAADVTENPQLKALALHAYAWAYRDADPVAAYDVSRRAMKIARDSGNRFMESTISIGLSRLAASHGDPIEALDYMVLAVRNYQDSGSFSLISGPLAMIAILFDRLGRYEPAAIIMGFGDVLSARLVFPEVVSAIAHLREILGDPTYESLARKGESMTTAAMATYAFDQIDQARAELEQPAECALRSGGAPRGVGVQMGCTARPAPASPHPRAG